MIEDKIYPTQAYPHTMRARTQSNSYIYAQSGRAIDIQNAIDALVADGTMQTVLIPEGDFNWVEPGEPWRTVERPAHINIIGVTPPDSIVFDDVNQVSAWKTILRMPFEAPGESIWIRTFGTQKANENPVTANLAFIGYRDIDPTSTTMYKNIVMKDVIDFRVHHCLFRNNAKEAVSLGNDYGFYLQNPACLGRGVIDNCKLINTVGIPAPVGVLTVGYGISFILEWHADIWEDDIDKVLGTYNRTVFVEDCYMQGWRHCTTMNNGAHTVVRHCVIKHDFGYGSLDAHGVKNSGTRQGSRCLEAYNNQFLDPENVVVAQQDGIYLRGGGGAIYNNIFRNHNNAILVSLENPYPYYQPKDLWIWNNTLENVNRLIQTYSGAQEGVNYYLYDKQYTPYPYPHPLTTLPITPFSPWRIIAPLFVGLVLVTSFEKKIVGKK